MGYGVFLDVDEHLEDRESVFVECCNGSYGRFARFDLWIMSGICGQEQ